MHWVCYVVLLNLVYVSSQEESCREGWYGVDCGTQCSDTCRPLETYPCHKDTGKCSEGCKRGYYGPMCERNCSCTGPCIQDTGDCIGNQPQTTPIPIPQPCQEQSEEGLNIWMLVAIVCISLLALIAVLFVSYIVYIRRTSRYATSPVDGTEMAELREPLVPGKKMDYKHMVHQLNNAREKIKVLEEKQKKFIDEHNITLKTFGLCQDSTYYLLKKKGLKRSKFLQCTWLKLDPEKINVTVMNLDAYGKLSNKPDSRPQQKQNLQNYPGTTTSAPQQERNLQNYPGTTTTAPLKVTGSAQYWEVKSNIAADEPLSGEETVLDFGFCNEEDRDKERFTPERKPCCSFRVNQCSNHNTICFKVYSDNNIILDQPTGKVINAYDAKDSTLSFNFGFLLHDNGKKITFFDLENLKSIQTVSIDMKQANWPMFGLISQNTTTVNTTLVCGNDISMIPDKMDMINKSQAVLFG